MQLRFENYRSRRIWGGMRIQQATIGTLTESVRQYRAKSLEPGILHIRQDSAAIALMEEKGCSEEDTFGDHCMSVEDMLRWEEIMPTIEIIV